MSPHRTSPAPRTRPTPADVAAAVAAAAGPPGACTRVVERRWGTVYFFTGMEAGTGTDTEARAGGGGIAVKVPRLPGQADVETSWTSAELLRRGRREFATLRDVHAHFAASPDPALRALTPLAYVPPRNAIVTALAPGRPLAEIVRAGARGARFPGPTRALLDTAGRWLRFLHRLPPPADARAAGPDEARAAVLDAAARLGGAGLDVSAARWWRPALDALDGADPPDRVACHGDFQPGNLLCQPDGGVVGFDTARTAVDSPCADAGHFAAGLRLAIGRRRFPRAPGPLARDALAAFLAGYGERLDPRLVALYELRCLLDDLASHVAETPAAGAAARARRVARGPFYRWLLAGWARDLPGRAAG